MKSLGKKAGDTFIDMHELIIQCAAKHPHEIRNHARLLPLRHYMRALIPKDGGDWLNYTTIYLPGDKKQVEQHTHENTHTLLYYVEPGIIQVEGRDYLPEVTEFLYLSPYELHAVPPPKARRVSVALLVWIEGDETRSYSEIPMKTQGN